MSSVNQNGSDNRSKLHVPESRDRYNGRTKKVSEANVGSKMASQNGGNLNIPKYTSANLVLRSRKNGEVRSLLVAQC